MLRWEPQARGLPFAYGGPSMSPNVIHYSRRCTSNSRMAALVKPIAYLELFDLHELQAFAGEPYQLTQWFGGRCQFRIS